MSINVDMGQKHRQTIVLKYPVQVGGVTYSELVMRRAKGRDVKLARQQANGDLDEADEYLLANLCDVSPEVLNEMDVADLKSAFEVMRGFLE